MNQMTALHHGTPSRRHHSNTVPPQARTAQWEMMVAAMALQALVMLVFSAGYTGAVWRHMARDTAPDAARFLQQTDHTYVAPHVMLR